MKRILYICLFGPFVLLFSCTGSKKYFKAAERLEAQGLVNEAAEFYYQSLQRKPTNVDARIKLKQVGQKYTSSLASDFFRNISTQQDEEALGSYEKMKDFVDRCAALQVELDYPRSYNDDYKNTVESWCAKNYQQAYLLVHNRKYNEAQPYITRVNRYNKSYKNIGQLSIVATCEPLYQSAVTNLENKNYNGALQALSAITLKTDTYKDSQELLELAKARCTKYLMLFEPKRGGSALMTSTESNLFISFSQAAIEKLNQVKVINNTPFQQNLNAFDAAQGTNVDLVQAVRKATGADYFYIFVVSNIREYDSGLNKTKYTGFQEVRTKKNDTLTVIEYIPFNYNNVKSKRSFSYEYSYRIIDTESGQMISTQARTLQASDEVEYQEFTRPFKGNMNSMYPYDPSHTAPIAQYNARAWRNLFSARSDLKSFDALKTDVYNQNVKFFLTSASFIK
ncbi:MAG TPA: hypothetical protein PLQ93_05005 [Bacteroidia bacterium]|nr:hypothetical protein [Bacteroidia bacterium]